jgi:predicted GIY-YIG superfamily endonuclease
MSAARENPWKHALLSMRPVHSVVTPRTCVRSLWYFTRNAIAAERQVKGGSRAKKEALISGNFDLLRDLAKRRS